MQALQSFDFQSSTIRTITDNNGEIWFIAKDVCEILDQPDTSKVCSRLDDDEKLTRTLCVSGQNREMLLINESGLYSLILTSRKTEAKAFKKWVTSEVLPSIRKTGSYSSTGNNPNINMMLVADNLEANIKIAKLFGFDGNQALLSANKATKQVTGIDCMALHGVELIAPSKDKFVTPTELGKQLGLSGMKVNLLLAEKGYQVKHGKNWHLTLQGKDLAILQDTNKKHSDGTPVQQIKWSQDLAEKLAA